jgi:stage II sporulation protein D
VNALGHLLPHSLASIGPPPRPPSPMLRRALIFATVFALVATAGAGARPLATARAKAAPPVSAFFVSGRGWGHGIGMSQWGAYGFAQRGVTYDQIVTHYYRGTTLGAAPVARIRVLLGEGKKALAVASESAFTVTDGSGAVHRLQPGPHAFGPGLKLKIDPAAAPKALSAPLVFSPGATPLKYGGKEYRGLLRVNVGRRRLQIVNHLGLEPYLYGVVPREVPSTWPAEALKAQAVVARSYALAVRKTGAAYDVFADTRSQVYGGIAAEKATTNAAVDATATQVLLYEGKVATTFFFSTSGGQTASIEDVWANGAPTPYLVSVPDPYETASPHHTWGPFSFTSAKLRATFKVPGQLVDVRVALNASKRVETMTLVGTKGEVVVSGTDVRTKLGLRSTWFRVGVLALERPAAAVQYGAAVKLKGVARGAGANVRLEQRVSGRIWEPAARVAAGPEGSFQVAVKPLVSTDYRLAVSSKVFGQPMRVAVAPRVRLEPVTDPATVRGLVRPVLPGVRVDVQRLVGSSWRVVGTTTVDVSGAFEASVQLAPGTYRARVAPGRGLVPGVSPVLRVVG